ncbi:MAG: hypothetical protein ISS33_00480 [Candidatus Omnitrophica bacterium]|nr:hypothetical protein [Candidatus Omnitrophota bacterium]
MVKNIRNILCLSIITSKETNTVSYINSIEELGVPKLPMNLPSFQLGTLWQKSKAGDVALKMRIKLKNPSGKIEQTFDIPEINIKTKRYRYNLSFGGLLVKEEGTYVFIVEFLGKNKWEIASEVPLEIRILKNK